MVRISRAFGRGAWVSAIGATRINRWWNGKIGFESSQAACCVWCMSEIELDHGLYHLAIDCSRERVTRVEASPIFAARNGKWLAGFGMGLLGE